MFYPFFKKVFSQVISKQSFTNHSTRFMHTQVLIPKLIDCIKITSSWEYVYIIHDENHIERVDRGSLMISTAQSQTTTSFLLLPEENKNKYIVALAAIGLSYLKTKRNCKRQYLKFFQDYHNQVNNLVDLVMMQIL